MVNIAFQIDRGSKYVGVFAPNDKVVATFNNDEFGLMCLDALVKGLMQSPGVCVYEIKGGDKVELKDAHILNSREVALRMFPSLSDGERS